MVNYEKTDIIISLTQNKLTSSKMTFQDYFLKFPYKINPFIV